MTSINLTDYILVKDKDGQLKYYKDGQFFSVEEIESQVHGAQEEVKEKKVPVILKPVLSFKKEEPKEKAKEEIIEKKIEPQKLEVVKKPQLKPRNEKVIVEEIKPNADLNSRRSEDQKLIEERVQHIIEKLKIKFSDDSIQRRFVNVLTTYFRGIRKVKEIEYILALPKISGGMGLPVDKVGLIVALLAHHNDDLGNSRKDVVTKVITQVATLDHRLSPPPLAIINNVSKETVVPIVPKTIEKPVVKLRTMVKPSVVKMTPQTVKKTEPIKIQDVKPSSRRLTGPVEELQYMSLEDFRRLGRDKKEIKGEVLERVMLLGEETLVKKIQGIKAWKSSPVFKIYLHLNLKGIQEKKSVEQLIEESQTKNEETLTLSEVEMIAELNRELSY